MTDIVQYILSSDDLRLLIRHEMIKTFDGGLLAVGVVWDDFENIIDTAVVAYIRSHMHGGWKQTIDHVVYETCLYAGLFIQGVPNDKDV